MVPETQWNQDFIKPTLFCSSINKKCVKNELELTDDHIILKANDSVGYKKPRFLPPNVLDASTKLIHLQSGNTKSQVRYFSVFVLLLTSFIYYLLLAPDLRLIY